MLLENVKLLNYRNYKNESINFKDGLNFIIGNNGQGKTNLLESIYIACIGRAFRTNKLKELFFEEELPFFIELIFKKNRKEKFIFGFNKKPIIKVNNLIVERRSELFGRFPMILFSPLHLSMVSEGPSHRRRFLDREISLIDKNYFINLINYNKILLLRNSHLRDGNIDENLLDIYDEKLVEYGINITLIREKFIKKLSVIAKKNITFFTLDKEELDIVYKSSFKLKNEQKNDIMIEEYKEYIKESRMRDIRSKRTNIGPHIDDIDIYINKKEVRKFASQGQIRLCAISIFFSLIEFIVKELGIKPIILLDDVFSELDINRKRRLLEMLYKYQTIITTTDLEAVPIDKTKNINIIEIISGKLRR